MLGFTGVAMYLIRRSRSRRSVWRAPSRPSRRRSRWTTRRGYRPRSERGPAAPAVRHAAARVRRRRNELVKALRKERRRDEATTLAALRRPTWEDWALNAVATSEPGATARCHAAAHVRDAQTAAVEGRAGPDVRVRSASCAKRAAALVRLADAVLDGAGRQAVAGAVNARLADVAASDDDWSGWQLGSSARTPNRRPARAAPSRRPSPDAEPPAPPRPAPPPAPPRPPEPPGPTKAQREAAAEAVRRHTTAVKARERVAATVERLTAELDEARAVLEHRSPTRRPPWRPPMRRRPVTVRLRDRGGTLHSSRRPWRAA